MPRVTQVILWTGGLAALLTLLALWSVRVGRASSSEAIQPDATPAASIAWAVIGDSDSHSYHDRIAFPPGGSARGGTYRHATWQWNEALARLRGSQLDPGPWGIHGTRGIQAHATEALGLGGRSPRKEDYRYNFAVSGEGCGDLLGGSSRQVLSLVELMDTEPARWRNGVVVMRIGVNTFGDADPLQQLALDPKAPEVQGRIGNCVEALKESVAAIHARHPGVRIVLVGIFDNAHWAKYLDRWRDPVQLANISSGLDVFDNAVRKMANADPRIAFFDDRAWFASRWGSRDANGKPAYREVALGRLRVANRVGDAPYNTTLADGHAGTVWNVLWAQSLVELLNARFGMQIPPIQDAEMLAFVQGRKLPPVPAQKLESPVASVNR